MRTLATLLVAATLSTTAWAQPTQCPAFYVGGTAPDYINSKLAQGTRELCNEAFGVFHSGLTRTSLWSAEHITRASLAQGKGLKRENSFHSDDRLPGNERAELRDYSGAARAGFDRGHLSPSRDMPTRNAQYESYSLSNIIPQASKLNQGAWEGVEGAVRDLVNREGELYVITGPAFIGGRMKMLKGSVMVPTHVWKAVYSPKQNRAGAYWYENTDAAQPEYLTIDQLAARIGLQPFPALHPSVRAAGMELPVSRPYRERNGGSQHSRGSDLREPGAMTSAMKRFFR